MSRLVIYGDIHGCYDEFVKLREKIQPSTNDIEVCVGDIITRGKSSIETLRYIQKYNIQSVLGNHEDKIIRYLNHQKADKKNPIVLNADEQNIINKLNKNDIEYLKNMPLFMRFGKITILHGGLQNHQNLDTMSEKYRAKILRLRFLDENYNFIGYGQEDKKSTFWTDVYDGNKGFVVYGHQKFKEVKINKNSLGVDTGCVYNWKLSAAIFEDINNKNFSIESVNSNIA